MRMAELSGQFKDRGQLLWIVLDGWGLGDHGEGDAIHQAYTPHIDSLGLAFASTRLYTHGHYVGLPAPKDIGGSEVGHITMGAGRIIPQGPTRIKEEMDSGRFFSGEALTTLIDNCLQGDAPLHLMGLLSDGNVHSHIDHYHAIIDHAEKRGVRRLYVHALLDGRDVPYQSALDFVEPLEARLERINAEHPGWDYAIASGGGREVITMDRDQNWDKVRRGWETHVLGRCENTFASATEAVKALRSGMPDAIDQDLPPFVVVRGGQSRAPIRDGHSVIFMNFRGDRAIQFTRAMVEDDFSHFEREGRPDVRFAGMMTYDEDTNLPPLTLMPPSSVAEPFGKRLIDWNLRQFRLAETQKYAHVTFFFNGGYREPLDPEREEYILIQSDKVDSFAQAPALQAGAIGNKAQELILSGQFDFGLINFANADMIGHTGDLAAAVQGVREVDAALGLIFDALAQTGGTALVTADHGNAEEMISGNPKTGKREINTRHSINPVPLYLFDPEYRGDYTLKPSTPEHPMTLANLASTASILMGREPPDDLAPPVFELD
ncbi:MAG: 2,3-bisphosphoglycerate-independent phosphoglycerate mutase [bacterium]